MRNAVHASTALAAVEGRLPPGRLLGTIRQRQRVGPTVAPLNRRQLIWGCAGCCSRCVLTQLSLGAFWRAWPKVGLANG